MISRCPDIAKLEAAVTEHNPRIARHVERCLACQGVLALMVGRTADIETPECPRAELLCAKRDVAPLSDREQRELDSHIGRCEPCRAIATGDHPVT